MVKSDGTVLLTIRPRCSGWKAIYVGWDSSVVIVKETVDKIEDLSKVRYLHSSGNWRYVDADTENKQLVDTLTLMTNSATGYFIPLDITTIQSDSIDTDTLNSLDNMIKNMSAREY